MDVIYTHWSFVIVLIFIASPQQPADYPACVDCRCYSQQAAFCPAD